MRRHHILIPLAALLATLPLFASGCSCGHDFTFHLQSWLEAAQQFRQGNLNPHWIFSSAWNAGEPRFIFYPPLSWTVGALLTFVVPFSLAPALYTFLVLTAAGFTMHRLARHFSSENAALLAATLYLANPYMLFNAFERTAYAELLAAVWLPLLLLAVLRQRPTIRGIAAPVALLWLTNAPAAVMGCYTLAGILLIRLLYPPATDIRHPERNAAETKDRKEVHITTRANTVSPKNLALTATGGMSLGLALSAFYLLPAAYERRFVQIDMAIIPGMRIEDNFLFGHFGGPAEIAVRHTISVIAVSLLITTALVLIALFIAQKTLASRQKREARKGETRSSLTSTLCLLSLCIACLLTPTSTFAWHHLPELAFLQFPWRLLSVLAVILALSLALAFRNLPFNKIATAAVALAAVAALAWPAIHNFRQFCADSERPAQLATLLTTHHGLAATDEYTPADADNDILRTDNPAYWLADTPDAFAPNTTPNPAATIPNYDVPPPPEQNISVHPPTHFVVHAPAASFLVLNLRDYPNWSVIVTDSITMNTLHPAHMSRDDGLIALKLGNGGDYPVMISWHRTLDQQLGLAITLIALLILAALTLSARSRKIEPDPQ